MKNILTLNLITLVLLCCGTANHNSNNPDENKNQSSKVVDPTVYGNTITSNELKEMLYVYASDEFEGRKTGEPGQKKAVEFIKDYYIGGKCGIHTKNKNY